MNVLKARLSGMRTFLLVLFVLDALVLIGLILMQMSRHAGLGGAFGGGGGHTIFGREEQSDPKRTATAWLAALFLVLSLALSVVP
jgi:preprotein translocase subunit SecG